MLYIENKHSKIDHYERANQSLEFCLAMKEKDFFQNYQLKKLKYTNHYFLYHEANRNYFDFNGQSKPIAYQKRLQDINPFVDEINYEDFILDATDKDLEKANPEHVKKFREDLKDCHSLEKEVSIYSKSGEEYTLKIYKNVDTNVAVPALNDYMIIEKNGIQYGDMTVVYTNNEIKDIIDKAVECFYMTSKTKIPLFSSKDDLRSYAKDQGIFIPPNARKEAKYEPSVLFAKSLHNKAYTEYSCIDKEVDLAGQGLGKQMYFYMAQHLNENNIQFYSSNVLSPKAQNLWKSLNKTFPNSVSEDILFSDDEEKRFCLNISKGMTYPLKQNKKNKRQNKRRPK